jgi:hypothetical protein
MKTTLCCWSTALALSGALITGQAITLTDLDPDDGNRVVSQEPIGSLRVGIQLGEPWQPFDALLTLDAYDLGQPLAGVWFDIANASKDHWADYRLEFFDSAFSSPHRLDLNSLFVGPQSPHVFRNWMTTPDFDAHTILLSGGTGVDPGQTLTIIFTFHPPVVDSDPSLDSLFTLGIRQTTTFVPDGGAMIGCLVLGLVGCGGAASFASRRSACQARKNG